MRHKNTVFHDLINHVPWGEFERLVGLHGSDRRVRRLDSKSQFLAVLFGQVSGADSLRAIEAGMASQRSRLYHLGGRVPARSTLADANARRPAALYRDLLVHMTRAADRRTRRHMRKPMRILDATRIRLPGPMKDWKGGACGTPAIKLHTVYDPDMAAPVEASVTSSLVNDITPAKDLKILPDAIYVFDLGYYSFDWWARLHDAGAVFVTRLKRPTRLCDVNERTPPEGIIAERTGRLAGQNGRVMTHRLREITVAISTGTTIRIATNDLDRPASEIAALYKDRWQIETFFKWIKQNLNIKRFLGKSQNAVETQIYIALIAHILIRRAHTIQTVIHRTSAFTKLIAMNLWQRRPITALDKPPPTPPTDPRQTEMEFGIG